MTVLSHNTQLLVFIVQTIKSDHLFSNFLLRRAENKKPSFDCLVWFKALDPCNWKKVQNTLYGVRNSTTWKSFSVALIWRDSHLILSTKLTLYDCFKYIQGMSHKTHYLQYLPVKNICSLLQNLQWTLISVLWETIKETSPKPVLQRLSHFREKIPQLNFFFFKIYNGFVVKVFTLQHSYNPLPIWPVWAGCIWKHSGGKLRIDSLVSPSL